jgi:uncharacterized protein YndB with AHSA1/START domain
MSQIEIVAEASSRAAPGDVFRLLRDGSTWPAWSLFDRFELEREGVPDRLGVGAIRVFMTRVSRAREEVVEVIPDRRLSYILLSGLPFEDYRAEVDLAPAPEGGTTIRWRSRFRPKQPAFGWFWRSLMTRTLRDVGRQLAKAAEDPAIVATADSR